MPHEKEKQRVEPNPEWMSERSSVWQIFTTNPGKDRYGNTCSRSSQVRSDKQSTDGTFREMFNSRRKRSNFTKNQKCFCRKLGGRCSGRLGFGKLPRHTKKLAKKRRFFRLNIFNGFMPQSRVRE